MKKVILLIDDDLDEHELFLAALQTIGKNCTLLSAVGADEAMEVLALVTPDVIFLDINMPGRDGFACLQQIKRIENCKDVPVEMYSTSNAEEDKRTAMALGAAGYMTKTESFRDLCRLMQEVLAAQHVID